MKMNQPAKANALDQNTSGLMGLPLDRTDGPLKVTGLAPYAYEVMEGQEAQRAAYGFVLEATIAKGRIASINTTLADTAPGVLLVMTHKNAPPQAPYGPTEIKDRFARSKPQLSNTEIRHYGEPVAFVVAETFEQARAAAYLITVTYAAQTGSYSLKGGKDKAIKPKGHQEPDSDVGNFDAAFAAAPVKVDAMYTTPIQIHAQMEPHSALAYWQAGRVHIHCSAQLLESAQNCVAATLRLPPASVRVVSRYVGGGFGGKLPIFGDVILAALASRELKRPVKTALTRQQMFHVTTHRSSTLQRLQIAAGPDGVITAMGHEAWSHSARFDNFYEPTAMATRSLYAGAHRKTRHRSLPLDLPVADSTRGPGEAVGMLGVECAMDELAHALNMDPVALRLRNEPAMDPEKNIPYSTRQLVQCMQEGSKRFGWSQRQQVPGRVRDGRWLIGMGMSAAIRGNLLRPSKCLVRLDGKGRLTVKMSMTDIGTGSYTVFTQVAAEMLGLPVNQVVMALGDSDFPETAGSGGSFGAASAGSALFDACQLLRTKLAKAAGLDAEAAVFKDGAVSVGDKLISLAALAGTLGMSAEGSIEPGDMDKKFSQQSYGAHFVEVAVDMDSGEVRVRRMLGVFAAGRILNMKTATSQALGGMVWGVGAALHEDAVIDERFGFFVNHDLAEYHVPAHADIPNIEAVFLPEVDDKANPLKIKGVGELGISGAGAAVANAVFNATGVRIRDFPLTLDKVIAQLPMAA